MFSWVALINSLASLAGKLMGALRDAAQRKAGRNEVYVDEARKAAKARRKAHEQILDASSATRIARERLRDRDAD